MSIRSIVNSAVVLAALVNFAACGKSASERGNGTAGEVVRVEGTATAERAGAGARTLAVADPVYADDTVSTGPSSSIDIRLAHNGALWQLGADARRRVDASAAWRAEPGSSEEQAFGRTDVDRTAAAGRHAEREAMERGQARDTELDEDAPMMERSVDDVTPMIDDGAGGAPGGGTKGTGFGLGEIGAGSGGGAGGGYGRGGGASTATRGEVKLTTLEVEGGLEKPVVARLMRQRRPALQRCSAHELKRDDSFSADVEVLFTIDPAGRLSVITVSDVPNGNDTLEHCLKAAIGATHAPSAERATTVRFRLVFGR